MSTEITQISGDVSVIICAYTEKRWDDLVAAIESVKNQTLPPREIIVVIDHNAALLKRVQEHVLDVIIIENTEDCGLSGARNSGIVLAKSTLVAFLDDDAIAKPDWLMLLIEGYTDAKVLGTGGSVNPLWLDKKPDWLPEEFHWVVGCTYQGMPTTTTTIRNPIGANMSFRRKVFDNVGGFRNEIGRIGTRPIGCEETELCIRVHQHWPESIFLYQPQAIVYHQVPSSRTNWHYFCSRCYSEGLSKAIVTRYVGAKDSLASERIYICQTLPQGILHGIKDSLLSLRLFGFLKAGSIIIGLTLTISGYLVGSMHPWRTKLGNLISEKKILNAAIKDHTYQNPILEPKSLIDTRVNH